MIEFTTTELEKVQNYIEKYKHVDENGCWLWSGATSKRGAPILETKRHGNFKVSHLTFRRYVRALKPGEYLRSTCGQKHCTNPQHLETLGRHNQEANEFNDFDDMKDFVF